MAVPVAAREILFPIYAFNVEVARAPWVTEEPMIAEMRLQWWRDALEEIASGTTVRKHEVTTPLAAVLDETACEVLDKAVQARRWDIYKDAFEDAGHFSEYLGDTGGGLMWVTARALGSSSENGVRAVGKTSALANFFAAIPKLESRGRVPLVDGRADAIRQLARDGLSELRLAEIDKLARVAALSGWRSRAILNQVIADPSRVANGELDRVEIRKRVSLLWQSLKL